MGDERTAGTRHAPRTAWVTLLATLALAAVLLPSLAGRAGRIALLPEEPWLRLDQEIAREFGMENPVLWLVEARGETIWTRPVLERIVELTRAALRIPGVRAVDVMSLASPNVRQVKLTATGMSPSYLMAAVPPTDAAVAELRRRVEADENLAGTLVTRDGRAAIVVANFPADGDPGVIAEAAIELRDRLSGPDVAIHVVGAPVLAREARRAAAGLGLATAAAALGATLAALLLLGASGVAAVLVAAVLTLAWSGVPLLLLDAITWPWSGLAVPPLLLLAATAVAGCSAAPQLPRWSRVLAIGAASAAGFATLALVLEPPMRAFGIAGAVGAVAAAVAGRVAAQLVAPRPHTALDACLGSRWLAAGALVLALAALPALARVQPSLSLLGYGERYLPAAATEGLRGLRRSMPPPTSLAIRVTGDSGFLADPAVLEAMDGVVQEARGDRRVLRAQSLADLVKIVNRTFQEDDPSAAVIPDDRGLIARYLALAYSPTFRRFVDRGLGRAAIWVDVASDRPADVAGVLEGVTARLREHPVPNAAVDLVGGDGAVLLVMARMARAIVAAGAALVVATVLGVAVLLGWRAAGCAAVGAVAAAAISAGGLGWLGLPADLLTLSFVVAASAAGAGAGAWKASTPSRASTRLGVLTAGLGAAACCAPLALAEVLGLFLLGHGVASLLAGGAVELPHRAPPDRS